MVDGLLNVMNGLTDIPFVEMAWSSAGNQKKYGVITVDGQKALKTGKSMISEKMLTGYIDVFEKKPKTLDTPNSVEDALVRIGIQFSLESVQIEQDTGYVHWEWRWLDTLNMAAQPLVVATFHGHDGEVAEPQIILSGHTVTAPSNPPAYTDEDIQYTFRKWNPAINTAITENTVFEAVYETNVECKKVSGKYYAYKALSPDTPYTSEQITNLIYHFNHGDTIWCRVSSVRYNATSIDTDTIKWWGDQNTAMWAT